MSNDPFLLPSCAYCIPTKGATGENAAGETQGMRPGGPRVRPDCWDQFSREPRVRPQKHPRECRKDGVDFCPWDRSSWRRKKRPRVNSPTFIALSISVILFRPTLPRPGGPRDQTPPHLARPPPRRGSRAEAAGRNVPKEFSPHPTPGSSPSAFVVHEPTFAPPPLPPGSGPRLVLEEFPVTRDEDSAGRSDTWEYWETEVLQGQGQGPGQGQRRGQGHRRCQSQRWSQGQGRCQSQGRGQSQRRGQSQGRGQCRAPRVLHRASRSSLALL